MYYIYSKKKCNTYTFNTIIKFQIRHKELKKIIDLLFSKYSLHIM